MWGSKRRKDAHIATGLVWISSFSTIWHMRKKGQPSESLFFVLHLHIWTCFCIIGYLPCARCSASKPLLSTKRFSLSTTERCSNCSGAGKVCYLISILFHNTQFNAFYKIRLKDNQMVYYTQVFLSEIDLFILGRCRLKHSADYTYAQYPVNINSRMSSLPGDVPNMLVHGNGDGKWAWPTHRSLWLMFSSLRCAWWLCHFHFLSVAARFDV
jgi:hypothetical protein